MILSTSGGDSRMISAAGVGSLRKMADMIERMESPAKARRPVIIS